MPRMKSFSFEPGLLQEPPVFTVTQVTGALRETLEEAFPYVRVQGEISNFSRPQSGHLYFSLVDDAASAGTSRMASAQLPCVMWRSSASRLKFRPENGVRVVVAGRLTVYEPRGTYQLVADRLQPVGLGELQRRFDALKEDLYREGLFAAERKRPLPRWPACIGLVTSPTGAAIRDFLRILFQRHPRAWVRVVPVRVQGDGSASEIVAALDVLNRSGSPVDVIVVTRGGGSLEDLWSFNEEPVARAIAASAVPVVSAIGHEVDYTIADFVADARAQTPTHASELVVPDVSEVTERLGATLRRLHLAAGGIVARRRERVDERLQSRTFARPVEMLARRAEYVDQLFDKLDSGLQRWLVRQEHEIQALAGRLGALDPRRVLARGYAKVTNADGEIVLNARQVKIGELVAVELASGRIEARVESNGDASEFAE